MSSRKCRFIGSGLVSALTELRGEILPYPKVPHDEVVRRDLQRKKPFKRNGSGYRDFLIWESIRRLMFWGTERVVFVTGNTVDFGEGPLVSPDLQETISNPHRLELVRGLKTFGEKFVIPRLKMVQDVKTRLEGDAGISFDLAGWLRSRLLDLLGDDGWGPIIAGFPDGVGSLRPTEVVAFEDIAVDDVRELSQGERLFRLGLEADIEFRIEVSWDEYIGYPEVRDWAGDAGEPFSFSVSRQVERLTLGINLIVDSQGKNVTADEIALIGGPFASVELTPR